MYKGIYLKSFDISGSTMCDTNTGKKTVNNQTFQNKLYLLIKKCTQTKVLRSKKLLNNHAGPLRQIQKENIYDYEGDTMNDELMIDIQ